MELQPLNMQKEAFVEEKKVGHGAKIKYLKMISEVLIPAMYVIFTIYFSIYETSFWSLFIFMNILSANAKSLQIYYAYYAHTNI